MMSGRTNTPHNSGHIGRMSMSMTTVHFSALSFFVFLCCTSAVLPAEGADLTGVWATDANVCNKLFVKNDNRVSFAKDSDQYGNGFIIEGREIRGQLSTCRIKSTKEVGEVTHMVAACATDIMLSDVQLSARLIDANTISRMFPDMPELDIRYYRCSM
jgi:hypothetical protein